jgi:hypothetical protein
MNIIHNIQSMSIQSLLGTLFIILIFAPFPLLILSAPLGYVKSWIMNKYYQRIIRKHYGKTGFVGLEQLKVIFPRKSEKQLEDIAYNMDERKTEYSYKF